MAETSGKREDPDLDRIGIFKEMSYLEQYVPLTNTFNEASRKGKQMMTNCTKIKKGNQDGYFDNSYSRLFEGEAYIEPIRLRRTDRLEKAKKNLEPFFKYTSSTKKQSGLGSNYGTFADHDKKVEYFSTKPRDDEPGAPIKKNFYVNPPKKGTGYGYPDVTINKMPPYFLEKEYEELTNAPNLPKKPEPRLFKPYRAGVFKQEYFDPNPYGTDKELPPSKNEEDEDEDETKKKAFYPNSPAKKDGGMKAGCFDIYPEYKIDPYPKIDLVPRGVRRYINAEKQMFRPVPGVKPYPIKSVINKNVQKKVNPQNFNTIKGVVYCKK